MRGHFRSGGAGLHGLIRAAAIAVSLAGLSASAFADDMDALLGRWDAGSLDCRNPQGDGVFEVERRKIRFFESICEIDSVRALGIGSAVTARMTCEGEGESWTDGLILARSEEDQLVIYYGSGYGFIAGRCGR